LARHGIPPALERRKTSYWPEFIRAHLAMLAGTDFFSVEVLTMESRQVDIAGITEHPNELWMMQWPLGGSLRRLIAFYVHVHNADFPHAAFRGQTPDEMSFGTGNIFQTNLTRQRKKRGPRESRPTKQSLVGGADLTLRSTDRSSR